MESRPAEEPSAAARSDHRHVRQLGRDLAKKLRVMPTPPTDDASAEAHAKALADLRVKTGADFDRAFLQRGRLSQVR